MTIGFTGGCMCGAVRYECAVDPIAMGNCHNSRAPDEVNVHHVVGSRG
jgi:hypothetical protein